MTSDTNELYLEDMSVGLAFRSSEHRMDADQIIAFASQFDPQPFHVDAKAAEGTFFQGLAASGWHTAAITMRLLVESMPFARGIIGGGNEITWPSATRPGDVLRVESKIVEIRPSKSKPDRAMVSVESLTLNQADEVRQKLLAKLIAFKRNP